MQKNIHLMGMVFLVCLCTNGIAQNKDLFMFSEIKSAYENNTRSYTGEPGENYWQNTVDYNIDVKIIPEKRLIQGDEKIVYYNKSPNKINKIVIRLYADILKKGNLRYSTVNKKNLTDGVHIKNIVINNETYEMSDYNKVQRYGTNLTVYLNEELNSNDKLNISMKWEQIVPLFYNPRTAAYDSSTFFIGYWYPQIAVYDDIFGWDELNYNIMAEFYNNLANFDVEITTPENFIVWATGTLENSKEVLPAKIYDKYQKAKVSDEVIHIIDKDDLDRGIKVLNNKWHYTATEVSDFAFALSDHYLWDAAKQEVNDRDVFVSAAYPVDTTRNLNGLVEMQQKAIRFFSEEIPGIPYPYEAFTTFMHDGPFGMEFPMIANNGQPDIPLTSHELFHTYFPMYVRTNERRWAWMDEGWAVYNTKLLINRIYRDDYELKDGFTYEYGNTSMGTIGDLPLITSSEFMSNDNYDFNSYQMPAVVIATLHQHLGEEMFKKCYREYIKRWAKKSPTPYDFFYTFENVSGQDLSWLWKPWFFEFGNVDIAINSVENDKLIVMNKGSRPVPVFIELDYKNGDKKNINKSAKIWNDGAKKVEISLPNPENIETILVNNTVPDINYLDNVYPDIKSIYKDKKISPGIFGEYIGERYYFGLSIINKDEIIYLEIPGLGISRIIYPKNEDHYQSLDGSTNLSFIRNESEQINGFVLDLVGWIIKCNKQK